MPQKVVDEDRARRKQLLEEKRAARRIAKQAAEEQQKQQDDAAAAAAASLAASSPQSGSGSADSAEGPAICYLLTLPEDAVHSIYSMLAAAELGCISMTCRSLFRQLDGARIPYILSRTIPAQLPITTQDEALAVLDEALEAGGDTGRCPPSTKSKIARDRQSLLQFCHAARFWQEALCRGPLDRASAASAPAEIPTPHQGRFVSCSPEHTLVRVGGSGSGCGPVSGVAAWGVGQRGQLGHGQRRDEQHPRRLLQLGYGSAMSRLPGGIRIIQVAAGGGLVRVAHSLLLDDGGRVLSFGTGQYGALGHGYNAAKQLPDLLQPKYINGLTNVVCVSAGELHSAAVTVDGDLYTWGDSFTGQCGHGNKRPQVTPRQVEQGGLEDECVSQVSCGSRHTLAVTEDGLAYSWGLGHFGALGRSFTPFEYDADAAVVGSIALVPLGEARDEAAELAAHLELVQNLSLEDASDQCIPKLIDSLDGIHIVGASAGHRHSMLLDQYGNLYSFGNGSHGCLGHGDMTSHHIPCRVAFDDENVQIRQFSAGVDMSMAVSLSGRVFGWGKTDGGRIGLGMEKASVAQPRIVPSPLAVDVDCGYVHSVIVGLDGTLHQCGGVGVHGQDDGQRNDEDLEDDKAMTISDGRPQMVQDLNIWHRTAEPKEVQVKKERWKKYGKYTVKGRAKMLSGDD